MDKILELINQWQKEADECDVDGKMTTIIGASHEADKRDLILNHINQLKSIINKTEADICPYCKHPKNSGPCQRSHP